MLASHWMKAIALLVYVSATAWVLTRCDRLMAPAHTQKAESDPAKTATSTNEEDQKESAAVLSHEAKLRARKRMAHDERKAARRARYQALEADLQEMIKTDLPGALAELAQASIRYRNKLSDLKHLKKSDQWERETPVKEAHTRARALTEEWYKTDLEAQKEREGPTLHSGAEIEALTKRLAAFKRGGEEIDVFAASLALLHGKVPEGLLLSAIEAIPRLVLPKDAFDPCRDPEACPKAPKLEAAAPKVSMTIRDIAPGVRLCLDASIAAQPLPLRSRPDFNAPAYVNVAPQSCRLTATGRYIDRTNSGGSLWFEVVHDSGHMGWLQSYTVRRERSW